MIVAGMPVSFALVDVSSLVKQDQPCTPRLDKANGRTKLVESVGVEVTLAFLMARSRENHVCYLGVQKKRMGCRELFWSRRV